MPFKAWSLLKADRGGRNIFAKRSRCEQQLYCWHHARKEEVRNAFRKYRFIYGNKVVHIKVPQIPGLRLPDIIDFAEKHIDIHSCLNTRPSDTHQDNGFVTLVWLSCLILAVATLAQKEFKEFIRSAIELQDVEFTKKRNTSFEALPNFVSLLKNTNSLSSKSPEILYRIKWKIPSISE